MILRAKTIIFIILIFIKQELKLFIDAIFKNKTKFKDLNSIKMIIKFFLNFPIQKKLKIKF